MDNTVVIGTSLPGIYGLRAEDRRKKLKDLPANIIDSEGRLPTVGLTGFRRNIVNISIANGSEGDYIVKTFNPNVRVLDDDAGRGHIVHIHSSHRTNYIPALGQRLIPAE